MTATWLQTTRRLLPRLARLSREIRPTAHLRSVADLDPSSLRERGIEALLWDVDGTLMAHHAQVVDPELTDAVQALFDAPELRHAIVSNCQLDRFAELGAIFPDIPIMLGFETEEGPAYLTRLGEEETWSGPGADRAAREGPSSPLRKPSGRLLNAALARLGLDDRAQAALVVGDQYFTDIASANLAGSRSVKVPTIGPETFPFPVRVSHVLEDGFYRLRYGRPRTGWPP